MNRLTAAHRFLPFGTRVRVHNLRNARTVEVEITDRGPFVEGRLIDLSRAAARVLGFQRAGLARVRLEVLPGAAATAAWSEAPRIGYGAPRDEILGNADAYAAIYPGPCARLQFGQGPTYHFPER